MLRTSGTKPELQNFFACWVKSFIDKCIIYDHLTNILMYHYQNRTFPILVIRFVFLLLTLSVGLIFSRRIDKSTDKPYLVNRCVNSTTHRKKTQSNRLQLQPCKLAHFDFKYSAKKYGAAGATIKRKD